MALAIEKVEEAEVCRLSVTGEVDLYSSPELRRAVSEAITGARGRVEVDLSGVEYMDSSGVAALVEGLRESAQRITRFVLIAPSPAVNKVLQMSRLDTVFDIE
jgi:anti-sigma B factor antagonist